MHSAPAVIDLAASLAGARDPLTLARRVCGALVDVAGAQSAVVVLGNDSATAGVDVGDAPELLSVLAQSPEAAPALMADEPAFITTHSGLAARRVLAACGATAAVVAAVPGPVDAAGIVLAAGCDEDRIVTAVAALAGRLLATLAAAEDARAASTRDRATGLRNEQGIVEVVARTARPVVVVAGMEDVAELTMTFGPNASAALTLQLAARLREIGAVEAVGVLGGGRIAVVVRGDGDDTAADEVVAAARRPISIGRFEVAPVRHAGIAGIGSGPVDARQLLERADVAFRHAVSVGKPAVVHTAALADSVYRRLALAAELRRALLEGEVVPMYQPQVDRAGNVVAVEALVRWRRADGTWMAPAEFLPVAERCGLIADIDLHVLTVGCAQLRKWAALGLDDVRLAVNLSAETLARPDVAFDILGILHRAGVEPRRIEVEITESLAADEGAWVDELETLRACGVSVAIDDFGTGYSSLARIHKLPIDRLKIDRSFVADLGGAGASVSAAVIGLARALGLRVLAEGIEEAAQKAHLDQLGCDEYQGFWFAPPLSSADVVAKALLGPAHGQAHGGALGA